MLDACCLGKCDDILEEDVILLAIIKKTTFFGVSLNEYVGVCVKIHERAACRAKSPAEWRVGWRGACARIGFSIRKLYECKD